MAKKSVNRKLKPAQLNDPKARSGTGGELRQVAGNGIPALTTQHGTPVADDQNSLRIGARGPTAMEDSHFREKIFHFDHERIPERVVRARGFGAHGYFENYEPLGELTRADLFQRPREKPPAFGRFSTVAGNKGSPDLAANPRITPMPGRLVSIGWSLSRLRPRSSKRCLKNRYRNSGTAPAGE